MYVKYSLNFEAHNFYLFKIHSVILAAHFINFSYIHFRAKMSPPLPELRRYMILLKCIEAVEVGQVGPRPHPHSQRYGLPLPPNEIFVEYSWTSGITI